jgi:hypothetical protein
MSTTRFHTQAANETRRCFEGRRAKIGLVQDRFLKDCLARGSAGGRSVLGRIGRTGIQGRLRACLRSRAKDLFPARQPRLFSAVPSGTVAISCNPTPHFVRGYVQPSRQMPGLITAAEPFGQHSFNVPRPYEQLGRTLQDSALVCPTRSRQTSSYPIIWTALPEISPTRSASNRRAESQPGRLNLSFPPCSAWTFLPHLRG